MNRMKRQNDRILKEKLPRSVGAQYATGDQWRNNSRKNEGMEPKQKQYPVVDVTLATSCEQLTHWKRLWCSEGLWAGGERDDRGWDGWMASLTRWTWVWVNSGSWWWRGRPVVLWFMGSQRVRHDWATELKCFMANRSWNSDILFSWNTESLWIVTAAMKLRKACSLEGKSWPT